MTDANLTLITYNPLSLFTKWRALQKRRPVNFVFVYIFDFGEFVAKSADFIQNGTLSQKEQKYLCISNRK